MSAGPYVDRFVPPCVASLAEAIPAFARCLKENGLAVSTPSIMDAMRSVSVVGVEDPHVFRTALKANLLRRIEESAGFDRLFEEFWGGLASAFDGPTQIPIGMCDTDPDGNDAADDGADFLVEVEPSDCLEKEPLEAAPQVVYSPREAFREMDFRNLSLSDDHHIAALIRQILQPLLTRVGIRPHASSTGPGVNFRRLFRTNLKYGGDVCELPRRRPKPRIRRLIFLCDVSGSMNPYLKFMMRFIKELQKARTRVETFVFATRLSRVTGFLTELPFTRAVEEIGRHVTDWSGGTRIGSCLHELYKTHGSAMLRPSTVVLIHSDGWDRGDIPLLERMMNTIQRKVYRVIWINPLSGGDSYEPTCRGMKAALPYVDAFLPGHNVAALEKVVGTLRSMM
ncbi:MAG: VWA domain-containing protein [Pseudomonadota bacterium]